MPPSAATAQPLRVRVEDRELAIELVAADASIADVQAQVAQVLALDTQAHAVRIISAGRELLPSDRVALLGAGAILHATVMPRSASQHRRSYAPAPVDLLERLDPSTLMMCVCGGTLATLWALVLTSSELFDLASIAILFAMTMAFVLPTLLGASPLPGWLRHLLGVAPLHQGPTSTQSAPGVNSGRPQQAGSYAPDGSWIPPRPQAQVRPGQPLSEQGHMH